MLNNENQWLPQEQVVELTGYKQHQKQQAALNQMGVSHSVRPDGSIVVFNKDLTSVKGTSTSGTYSFVINKDDQNG